MYPALAYMAGIGIADGRHWPFWPLWLLSAVCLATLAVAAIRRFPQASLAGLGLACALTGTVRLHLTQTPLNPNDLRHHHGPLPRMVAVRGHLISTPQETSTTDAVTGRTWTRTAAVLQLDSIQVASEPWAPAHGRVQIRWNGSLTQACHVGWALELQGVLCLPNPAAAPGLFDPREFLSRTGIHHELRSVSPSNLIILTPPSERHIPYAARFQAWGAEVLSLGLNPSDPGVRSTWSMALGFNGTIPNDARNAYLRTGTLHVFAISGLHITLIAQLLSLVLRSLGLPRPVVSALVLPLIWTYTALTGWQASAIRSTLMSTVIETGGLLSRPAHLLNSLAAAAFLILVWDPEQLFQVGFQLSFVVVFGLGTLTHTLKREHPSALDPDDAIPESWVSNSQQALRTLRHHIAEGFKMSLAAWLISTPLIAHYFHLCTPISLLANLLVVPLSSLTLGSCMASLIVSPFLPAATIAFNHASWFLMDLMTQIARFTSTLPGAWFQTPSPGWDGFTLYYLLLAGVVLPIWKHRSRTITYLCIITTTLTLSIIDRTRLLSTTRITILPTRGAGTHWIQPSSGQMPWLINGGNRHDTSWITLPFLQSQGIQHLPAWIISHPNSANMGGAMLLEDSLHPTLTFLPRFTLRSTYLRQWLDHPRRQNSPPTSWIAGDQHGPWTVLHPPETLRARRGEDAGLVLLGTWENVTVLILPDLSWRAQNQLWSTTQGNLHADIVLSGISREDPPLADGLLQSIQPSWIFILDQDHPWAGSTKTELKDRLHRHAREVHFQSELGCIELQLRKGSIRMHSHGINGATPP